MISTMRLVISLLSALSTMGQLVDADGGNDRDQQVDILPPLTCRQPQLWCGATHVQSCYAPWEKICPTSAQCDNDDDCRVWTGGCGIYGCQCIALGANEPTPQDCPPGSDQPCACPMCEPGTCNNKKGACVQGTCGIVNVDEYGCKVNEGEEWCESLMKCNKPWENLCPTSASCTRNEDCEMLSGGCGSAACKCFAKGIFEDTPEECPPFGEPCACARCAGDPCGGQGAACIAGKCGLAKVDDHNEFVCNVEIGEAWCESLRKCHIPWDEHCPSSARCSIDDDCKKKIVGCGENHCKCIVAGANEPFPPECSPNPWEHCSCADCAGDACANTQAACIAGRCAAMTFVASPYGGNNTQNMQSPTAPSPTITQGPDSHVHETDGACARDVRICPDRTQLERDPMNNCQFPDCAPYDFYTDDPTKPSDCSKCTMYYPGASLQTPPWDRGEISFLTSHACAHETGDMSGCCRPLGPSDMGGCGVFYYNGFLYPCDGCQVKPTDTSGNLRGDEASIQGSKTSDAASAFVSLGIICLSILCGVAGQNCFIEARIF